MGVINILNNIMNMKMMMLSKKFFNKHFVVVFFFGSKESIENESTNVLPSNY